MISLSTAKLWYKRVDVSGTLQKKLLTEASLLRRAYNYQAFDAIAPQDRRSQIIIGNAYAASSLFSGTARLLSGGAAIGLIKMGKPPVSMAEWVFGRGDIQQVTDPLPASASRFRVVAVRMLNDYKRMTAPGLLGLALEVTPTKIANVLEARGCNQMAALCVLGATLGRCALQPFRLALAIVGIAFTACAALAATALTLLLELALRALSGVVGVAWPNGSTFCALMQAVNTLSSPYADYVPWPAQSDPLFDSFRPDQANFFTRRLEPRDREFVRTSTPYIVRTSRSQPSLYETIPVRRYGWVRPPPPTYAFEDPIMPFVTTRRTRNFGNVALTTRLEFSSRPRLHSFVPSMHRDSLFRPFIQAPTGLFSQALDAENVERAERLMRSERVPRPLVQPGHSDALAASRIRRPCEDRESHQMVRDALASAFARFQVIKANHVADMVSAADARIIPDQIVHYLRVYCRECTGDAALRGGIAQLQAFMQLTYEEAQWQPPADMFRACD